MADNIAAALADFDRSQLYRDSSPYWRRRVPPFMQVTSQMDGKSPTCAICNEALTNDVVLVSDGTGSQPMKCGHKFHEKCLFEWVKRFPLGTDATCPSCRNPINAIFSPAVIGGKRRRSHKRKDRRTRRYRRSTRKN